MRVNLTKRELEAIASCLDYGIEQVTGGYLHGPHLDNIDKKPFNAAKSAIKKITLRLNQ